MATNLPNNGIGTVEVCGQVLSTTNLIHLYCRAAGSGNRSSCARAGDNAGTPTSYSAGKGTVGGANAANGKAFRIHVMVAQISNAGAANSGIEAWYSDNDLGQTSVGTFTNGVNFIGITNGNGYPIIGINASTGNSSVNGRGNCAPFMNWLIPNGKFPGVKTDGTAGVMAEYYGYKE